MEGMRWMVDIVVMVELVGKYGGKTGMGYEEVWNSGNGGKGKDIIQILFGRIHMVKTCDEIHP